MWTVQRLNLVQLALKPQRKGVRANWRVRSLPRTPGSTTSPASAARAASAPQALEAAGDGRARDLEGPPPAAHVGQHDLAGKPAERHLPAVVEEGHPFAAAGRRARAGGDHGLSPRAAA